MKLPSKSLRRRGVRQISLPKGKPFGGIKTPAGAIQKLPKVPKPKIPRLY